MIFILNEITESFISYLKKVSSKTLTNFIDKEIDFIALSEQFEFHKQDLQTLRERTV